MLTKEQLLGKRNELIETIKVLEERKFEYVVTRPFQQFGEISEMSNENLICAFAKLKDLVYNLEDSANELGIDMESEEAETVQGFTFEEWKKDFITRKEQNDNYVKLGKYRKALQLIEENLSDDDKFNIAMNSVSELIGE